MFHRQNCRGSVAFEHGILLAFIAVAVIGGLAVLGETTDDLFEFIADGWRAALGG